MRSQAKDQPEVEHGVVVVDNEETLGCIHHILVLKVVQDEDKSGEHTDSSEHIQVYEGEHCCVRQGC